MIWWLGYSQYGSLRKRAFVKDVQLPLLQVAALGSYHRGVTPVSA